MNRHPSARDLGRETQRRMGEVLERQIAIAQHVLDPAELILMMIEVAASAALTAAASAAATAHDDAMVEELFDTTLAAIATFAAGDRARSLAVIAEKRAAAA